MGNRTADRPKCLTMLAGRSLLDWQVAALRHAGMTQVSAVGGYMSDKLREVVPVIAENTAWRTTNMVATLLSAREALDESEIVVSYSDIVYHPSYVADLAAAPGDIAITFDLDWAALWRLRFGDPLEDAESFQYAGNRLVEIGNRAGSMEEIQGQYMGLLKITRQGWRSLDAVTDAGSYRTLDMTGLLQRLLAAGVPVGVVAGRGRWVEVDSGSDLERYEARLSMHGDGADTRWSHDWRWQ